MRTQRQQKPSLMEELMAFNAQDAAIKKEEAQAELTQAQIMAMQERLPLEMRLLRQQPKIQQRGLELQENQFRDEALLNAIRRRMMPKEVENASVNASGNLAQSMALSAIDPLQIRAMLASRLPQMVQAPTQDEFVESDPVLRKLNQFRKQ